MTVTLKPKTEITVPKSIRRKAGIKPGDRFRFAVSGRVITIAPAEEDEYTPAQRRNIDAQLDQAEKGKFYGPFNSADDMIADLKGRLTKPAKTPNAKRSR